MKSVRSAASLTLLLVAGAALVLAGCGESKVLPAAQLPEVATITVQVRETPVTAEYTAQTESANQVEIRTRISGFLDQRVYREGEIVRPGQVLFRIDGKLFEVNRAAAKGELAAQEARLATARATLARVRPLAEQNALSKKDLDDAVGQELAAQAAVEVARANVMAADLNLGYATIHSPIAGLAGAARVQVGSFVNANGQDSLLTTVASLDPIRINFSVSENDLLRSREQVEKGILRPPVDGRYQVEIVLADGRSFPQKGIITFADTGFGLATGTLSIRAEVANPQLQLRPGQFVKARLHGAVNPRGVLIPQKAVQQGGQGNFVWLIDKESKAQPRPVTVGAWQGEDWFILDGLKAGDIVAVDGLLRLAPGVPVRVAGAATTAAGAVGPAAAAKP